MNAWFESHQLYLYIAGIILYLSVSAYYKTNKGKGEYEEAFVALMLSTLDKEKYHSLHDVILTKEDGKTTQIDHIIVSIYGVFVIETKNFGGIIIGNEDWSKWTQKLGKKSNKFYSPIIQNKGHIKALKYMLGKKYKDVPIHSIVAFSGRAELKVKSETKVVYTHRIKRALKKYDEVIVTKQEMLEIFEYIKDKRLKGKGVADKHVRQVQSDIQDKEEKINSGICPRCGALLVQKRGKRKIHKQ